MGLFLFVQMPYKSFPVEDQYCVYKLDANDNRTGESLGCHPTKEKADAQVAALYAAEGDTMNQDNEARSLFDKFWQGLKDLFIERRIKDVDSWDGSASRWPDTGSYCKSCLINENTGSEEDWVQAKCHLPVRDPGDSSDTFVRQAVHAAAQRFNQVQASSSAKASARRKLLSAYRQMDEDPPDVLTRAVSMSRLHQAIWSQMLDRDRQNEEDNYMMDIYADEGMLYALGTDRGKLYRYPVAVSGDNVILGERVQVMETHPPVATRTVVRQQEDGRYRWFSVSATAVLNRSGEIDSRELFDSCIRYAEETGRYPVRMFYHRGVINRNWEMDESARAFRTGQADFLARDGYCYLTSGLYDDTPLARAEIQARQANPDFWGDSIGFWPTTPYELTEVTDGIKIPVYCQGFNVEISTLPETDAAHLFTHTEVTRMALQGKEWEAFLALWSGDEEKARQWLEENPEARNRAIEQAGLITRNGDQPVEGGEPPEGNVPATEPPEGETPGEVVIDDTVIEAVTNAVERGEIVKALSDKLAAAEAQLIQRTGEIQKLETRVIDLVKRLEKLEGAQAAAQQQFEDDLPSKFTNPATRVVYRPRMANAAAQEDGTPYNEKAKSNMPKGVQY
jgi:hypothetical protein